MPDPTTAALIRRYYDACTDGDLAELGATLHPDVVHWFLAPNVGSAPVRGREHLARYWRKVTRMIDARWVVDHVVTDGDEAVIEWTMFWRPDGAAERVATRGAEWFVLRDGLIAEIRSYYQQRPETTGLDGFPYAERGYAVAGREASDVHPDAVEHRAPLGASDGSPSMGSVIRAVRGKAEPGRHTGRIRAWRQRSHGSPGRRDRDE
ncbi:MAG TPA: nuclear transport factor 2 family protein [Microbacteriaceae bacterium]|nr:nuclear transport factor 2 family protein [Microbacteriaceae bacterium]